ncbi:MAG: NAD(P)/FAD-dependent oxidoreductase [Deltaproteobacteria bacterium]|nr:NAD(P)/FAD-dependent oxidoreductase [Deltaproteobacteria bacterium]
MNRGKRLVVIGNGMAGARVVEEILKRDAKKFEITMFGAEPYGNYNRILLSNVLNGTETPTDIFINPLSWYEENGITLHAGVKAIEIDREKKVVVGRSLNKNDSPYAAENPPLNGAATVEVPYDSVIIATGSRPFVPPVEGYGGPGAFLFRTLDDCAQIEEYAKGCKKAAVIGGGLLGLEAARGLMTHHVHVTVLEAAPQLMPAQLDAKGGRLLRSAIEAMGIAVFCGKITTRIERENGLIQRLIFKEGEPLETDMVVVSAGIRPVTEIAKASGLTVERGIVCNDQMRTNDPEIFALGECVEHRGQIYGLVGPIWEQAEVLADVMTEADPKAKYTGSKLGTKLKVMGVDLVSMGQTESFDPAGEVVTYREPKRGIYQKLLIRNDKLIGAILLGDVQVGDTLMQTFKEERKVSDNRSELLFGVPEVSSLTDVLEMPDSLQICNCNGVSKGEIRDRIRTENCTSVAQIGKCTKAGTGCGSCKMVIAQLIRAYAGEIVSNPSEHYYVPGVPLEKSELIAAIQEKGLKSVSAIFRKLAGGKEHAESKAGLASLLKSIWNEEYEDERDARFINDRVHANIQRNRTFSVVPRIYGGVTSAEELIRIGTVAKKYKVPMVKITGGQRIDLLGIQKEDLPKVWKELGIPSGHAYTKAVRTVKSCVGTDFCRYGLGDSIRLAQEIERRYQGIESPHKIKMATAGCPRNCSEAYVKDVGVVAIEGGKWEIYVGGAAGGTVRKGDLLCTVDTHEEVLKYVGRFIQYYREHAKYMERTYGFAERIGIGQLKAVLIEDELGICNRLDTSIEASVQSYKDPWREEADLPADPAQFKGPEWIPVLKEAVHHG